jgi:hypothetical protein
VVPPAEVEVPPFACPPAPVVVPPTEVVAPPTEAVVPPTEVVVPPTEVVVLVEEVLPPAEVVALVELPPEAFGALDSGVVLLLEQLVKQNKVTRQVPQRASIDWGMVVPMGFRLRCREPTISLSV